MQTLAEFGRLSSPPPSFARSGVVVVNEEEERSCRIAPRTRARHDVIMTFNNGTTRQLSGMITFVLLLNCPAD